MSVKFRIEPMIILLLVVFFIIDRFLKFYFLHFNKELVVIKNLLSFKLVFNQGVAFGLKLPMVFIFLVYLLSSLILMALIIFYWQRKILLGWFLFALMLLGVISNFIDRLKLGAVIDYIDVSFFTIFNLSDVMICCSVLILIFLFYKNNNNLFRN